MIAFGSLSRLDRLLESPVWKCALSQILYDRGGHSVIVNICVFEISDHTCVSTSLLGCLLFSLSYREFLVVFATWNQCCQVHGIPSIDLLVLMGILDYLRICWHLFIEIYKKFLNIFVNIFRNYWNGRYFMRRILNLDPATRLAIAPRPRNLTGFNATSAVGRSEGRRPIENSMHFGFKEVFASPCALLLLMKTLSGFCGWMGSSEYAQCVCIVFIPIFGNSTLPPVHNSKCAPVSCRVCCNKSI